MHSERGQFPLIFYFTLKGTKRPIILQLSIKGTTAAHTARATHVRRECAGKQTAAHPHCLGISCLLVSATRCRGNGWPVSFQKKKKKGSWWPQHCSLSCDQRVCVTSTPCRFLQLPGPEPRQEMKPTTTGSRQKNTRWGKILSIWDYYQYLYLKTKHRQTAPLLNDDGYSFFFSSLPFYGKYQSRIKKTDLETTTLTWKSSCMKKSIPF